jgi:hypothetical protein
MEEKNMLDSLKEVISKKFFDGELCSLIDFPDFQGSKEDLLSALSQPTESGYLEISHEEEGSFMTQWFKIHDYEHSNKNVILVSHLVNGETYHGLSFLLEVDRLTTDYYNQYILPMVEKFMPNTEEDGDEESDDNEETPKINKCYLINDISSGNISANILEESYIANNELFNLMFCESIQDDYQKLLNLVNTPVYNRTRLFTITGNLGTGKTTMINQLIHDSKRSVLYVSSNNVKHVSVEVMENLGFKLENLLVILEDLDDDDVSHYTNIFKMTDSMVCEKSNVDILVTLQSPKSITTIESKINLIDYTMSLDENSLSEDSRRILGEKLGISIETKYKNVKISDIFRQKNRKSKQALGFS